MEDGVYKVQKYNHQPFYVVIRENSIALHPLMKTNTGWIADTSATSVIQLSPENPENKHPFKFVSTTFDLDVITIVFKYRPYTKGFPNQLNTNFNAAEFIGHRRDVYILSYDKNPLNSYERRMNHFAYSIGFFAGLGATQINPFVTGNRVQSEYDGVVFTKGVAGLIGIGNLTFGAAIGLDHLMDKNRKAWIYQSKPWAGFTVGFNIN
jgi:hypothetical protein